MEEFIEFGDADAIKDGSMMSKNLSGNRVLLVRVKGAFYALEDRCPHRGCLLSSGWVTKHHIICACHLSRFDIKSGKAVAGPANHPLAVYEVKISDGRVFVKVKSK